MMLKRHCLHLKPGDVIAYFDHAAEDRQNSWAWAFVDRVLPTGGVVTTNGQLIPYRWIFRVSTKAQQEAWEAEC